MYRFNAIIAVTYGPEVNNECVTLQNTTERELHCVEYVRDPNNTGRSEK